MMAGHQIANFCTEIVFLHGFLTTGWATQRDLAHEKPALNYSPA